MTETSADLMRRLAANTRVGYSFDQEFYASDAVFQADMDRVISRSTRGMSGPRNASEIGLTKPIFGR